MNSISFHGNWTASGIWLWVILPQEVDDKEKEKPQKGNVKTKPKFVKAKQGGVVNAPADHSRTGSVYVAHLSSLYFKL